MLFDYRNTLRQKMEQRILRNSSYSLRSFARDLTIPASRLSEILNNKRGTTVENGKRMAKNLYLSNIETENFLLSIEALHSRSPKRRNEAQILLLQNCKKDNMNLLSEDRFAVIASWYHYAILELLSTKEDFKMPADIAKRLGITTIQAKQALDRLEKLSLIKKSKKGYEVLTETSFTTHDVPSDALKSHHEEHLKLAIKSLYEHKVESREIGSTTIAIDKSQVNELKNLIREFRQKIASIADNSNNKNSVYLLGTQLFRLDKENENV